MEVFDRYGWLGCGGIRNQQGIDVARAVLALSTYIGHAKVSDTYWYFTGIPELMAIAAERFERYAEGAPQ